MKGLGTAAASAAVILLSGAGGAYAADLPIKAPAVMGPCGTLGDFFLTDCQLAYGAFRFYGTVDMGLTYETHGAPMDRFLGVNSFLGKMSNKATFTTAPNGLSASNVGLQIKQGLWDGWSFVGQVEMGFNPYSGMPLNGVHSVYAAIGTPLLNQTAFGDSNSQGAFFNDLGFAGFSHDTWGTLTFFRQNDLMQDAVLSYDPMGLGSAFSPLGFFGGYAGAGDTQNRRDTTAIKYRLNVANWHFGAYGQVGGYEEGNAAKGGVQGDVGADFHVGPGLLSVDALGAFKKDAVSLGVGLAGPLDQFGFPLTPTVGGLGTAGQTLGATISNNTAVMTVAKYQVDKLKLFGGWERIEFSNPSDPQSAFRDIAGDYLCAGCQSFNGTNINNTFYNIHKVLQLAWAGAKYSITDSLDVTGAFYYEWQNDFSGGATFTNVSTQPGHTCADVSTVNGRCQGSRISESVMLDWKFAPKWDTYVGVLHSHNNGGFDNGYLQNDVWSTTGGVRFRW